MKKLLKDLLLSVKIAGCAAAVPGAILFILGLWIGKSAYAGVAAVRSGLMVVGAFLLLVSAGLFLKGSNLPSGTFRLFPKEEHDGEEQPKIFQHISKKWALLLIGALILLFAAGADRLLLECF